MNPEASAPAVARDRSAHASLRGYLYQVCLGVQRWLALTDDEVLVCEGDEDLDRRILGTGGGTFEQVKDYRGRRLGLGDTVVVESLRNFLRGYVDLKRQGQPGRYVFTTTAEPSRRRDNLDFDLLQKWRDGDRSKKTCKEVRKLVAGKGAPKWIAEPKAWLDTEAEGWKGFLAAVEWTFGAPDLKTVRREIGRQIADHPTLSLLPSEEILERLVGEVLLRSSQPERAKRMLTRGDLGKIADSTQADLAKWLQTKGAPLRRLFEEIRDLDHLLTAGTLQLGKDPGPGELLTAAYEVIPFREAGRDKELALLVKWCNGEERRDVLLLTGEGGAGKTRLAIEWCRRLRHQGWHAGFLRRDRKENDLDSLLTGAAPRLIVIDYAETRLGVLNDLLYKMALDQETGPKVRLLLLSRRAGDWWTALREGREAAEIRNLLASSEVQEIAPLTSGEEERRSAFRAAAEGFALARGGKLPKRLPEPPLEDPDFEFDRALYLHMAALAALEGKTIGSAAEALAETLKHERRFWQRQVEEIGLDKSLSRWMLGALSGAVAALTLIGGANEERAQMLLGPVLDPAAGRNDLVEHLTETLRQLYGRNQEKGLELEPLRPDLLGEELITSELERDPALLDRVLDGATAEEAQKALTVLTRLAQRRPGPGKAWLAAAFRGERLKRLAEPAFEVAIETGDPVGRVLAQEIEERASGDLAQHLMDRCEEDRYFRSVQLWEVGLASTQRCCALQPEPGEQDDEAALAKRARLANNLGYRLSDLGRREEALAATEEAVRHYRTLASARPDAFLPDLAMSLNNLGLRLSDLRRHVAALAVTDEAARHYRTLAAAHPGGFLPELAMSLNNLGIRLSELGRREEALATTEEAVQLRRALASTRPGAFLPELATSFNNLGVRLSDLERREEALAMTEEAVQLRRTLAAARPDAFLPDLATSLNNLGGILSALGRHEEALAATKEAVQLRRSLATARPAVFLSDLAMSLDNLGKQLSDLERREEGLAATEEAARHFHTLEAAYPGVFSPDLATSLNNLGIRLSDLGRREEALVATEEAVRHYRTLASARPAAFLPGLAMSLNNLGLRLSDLDRREEALAATEEAVWSLAPFFLRHPAALRESMTIMTGNYLRHSKAAGREPDYELLAPLLELFGLSASSPSSESPES